MTPARLHWVLERRGCFQNPPSDVILDEVSASVAKILGKKQPFREGTAMERASLLLNLRRLAFVGAVLGFVMVSTRLAGGARIEKDLEYVAGGHARHKLDLYLPAKADRRWPVIVWVHGGAWWAGSKENCMAAALVGRGYAVASINYRLSQHALFPAQIEDCKAAIRWLRANAEKYGLDGRRIGVWGASAGGHLVALLGTSGDVRELEGKGGNLDQSSRVQCVVDFFGPSDVTQMGGRHDDDNSPEAKLLGGPVQQNKEKAARANPITYVSKDDPPFLIMHGEEDRVVPIHQSELLDAALRRAGVECTFVRIPGNGHGGPGFMSPENRKKIEEFFAKHLK